MSDKSNETVEELATRMSDNGRNITVWVKADTGATPRQGNAITARVASLLTDSEESPANPDSDVGENRESVVYDPENAAELRHDQITVFTFDPITTEAEWYSVLDALSGGRAAQPNVIIHAAAVPTALRSLIDVCITVPDDGGIGSIHRYSIDDTTSEVAKQTMAGFVGGATDQVEGQE